MRGHQPDPATLLLIFASLVVAGILLLRPLMTNDGPVHIQFVQHLVMRLSAQTPLQHAFYDTAWRLQPNMLTYAMAYPLVALGKARLAEGLIQAACILFPAWTARFAARQIRPMGSWAGLAVLALSINTMLMLGQYNTLLSYGSFFLTAGFAIRLVRRDNSKDAVLLALSLAFASGSHAAGFLGGFLGCSSLLGVRLLGDLWSNERIPQAIWRRRRAVAALVAGGAVGAVVMLGASTPGGSVDYGMYLMQRVRNLLSLRFMTFEEALRPVFVATAILILGLGVGSLFVAWRDRTAQASERLWLCAGLAVAAITAFILALVFPDSTGGAWTHYRRFAGLMFFWLLLLAVTAGRTGRTAGLLTATFLTIAVINFAAAERLDLTARREVQPLAEVDRMVGAHCTVLPLVWDTRPRDAQGRPLEIEGEPYLQVLTRLELRDDRVVLYNYLGRLQVYPSRFRPEMEPQAGIFHWAPNRQKSDFTTVDVDGFEARSGAAVDYVVTWGQPPASQPGLAAQVDGLRRSARLVYTSPDGRLALYRRAGRGRSMCAA